MSDPEVPQLEIPLLRIRSPLLVEPELPASAELMTSLPLEENLQREPLEISTLSPSERKVQLRWTPIHRARKTHLRQKEISSLRQKALPQKALPDPTIIGPEFPRLNEPALKANSPLLP